MALDGEAHPRHVALRRAREVTLARLSECFARDELSLDDFERRVDAAYAAGGELELGELVLDLAPASPSTLTVAAGAELGLPASPERPRSRLALAVFGSVERRLQGSVLPGGLVTAVFGNVELDLRELSLPPGVTELEVRAVFGNVELTVPPELAIDCRGTPVFGSFASLARLPREPSGEAVLRIVGSAVFGNVEVRTLPSRALLEGAGASRRLRAAR
jgi:hypothetical protein